MHDDDLKVLRETWGHPDPPAPAAYSAARDALLRRGVRVTGPAGRRKVGWLAGGLGLAVATAAASLLVFTSASAPTPGTTRAALTAFTVVRHGGTVEVTLHQMEQGWSAANRAALQRELRREGVPAVVGGFPGRGRKLVWSGKPPASAGPPSSYVRCYRSPVARRVFTTVGGPGFTRDPGFDIHLAAIPRGARVIIAIYGGPDDHGVEVVVPGFLLTRSGRCLDT
jgi:hypothetical protein